MTIGITGANGQLGRLVIEELKAKNANIIALVRNVEKSQDLGVDLRSFDYTKVEGQVEALKGIDTLLLISGSEIGQRIQQHQNVIEAAQKAGVKHIVYTSLLHADKSTLSLGAEHAATEEILKKSGLTYTILRNGWYTENYLGAIPSALQFNAMIGSAGNGKIASASRQDYAEAAVAVLLGNGHENKTYELAGDEAYTLADFAAELSKQTGKNIPYQDMPASEYAKILASTGMPQMVADMIAGFDSGAANNDLYHNGKDLSTLIGRKTTPLAETLKGALNK